MDSITCDGFMKMVLWVGKVLAGQRLEKAKKPAYILQVDIGPAIGVKKSSGPQITKGVATRIATPKVSCGAGGRNRTDTTLRSEDFESSASTCFTTPAWVGLYANRAVLSIQLRLPVCQQPQNGAG